MKPPGPHYWGAGGLTGYFIMAECLWPTDHLFTTPGTYPADVAIEEGVESLFFDGLPYDGKPTRVYAYFGMPSIPVDGPVPGIVLVHGGGGTAFAKWVRLWNSRGYAAIAMDLNGCVPVGVYGSWNHHEWGGPSGISAADIGLLDTIDLPVNDQWYYHAVAAVIRAHSLLRSIEGVDKDRIGVTGLSWGGYTVCIVAGIDARFRFAVPVYGCGFIEEMSFWTPQFENLGVQRRARWADLWDPRQYLPGASMPMLWVTGTNDFAYPLASFQRSYRIASGPRTLCIRIRMPHGHDGPGENPAEIHAFADSMVGQGPPLAQVTSQVLEGSQLRATYTGPVGIESAELVYTLSDNDNWEQREWQSAPTILDREAHTVNAHIPCGVTTAFLNLVDSRQCVVSTEHVVISATELIGG